MKPPVGVNPIVVSTGRPSRTAAMLAPLPRCAMADGVGRGELGGVERGEGGTQRGAGVGEDARRLASDALRVVARGDAPAVGPDLLDGDRREPRLAFVECELQRRRPGVETEDA